LNEFLEKIEKNEKNKNDYLVNSKSMNMFNDSALAIHKEETPAGFELTDYAHGQLASKLNIPKKYYDKMGEISGLRSYNVNQWFKNQPQTQIVRTLDGKARAFLSDRFKPIDNHFVLQAFLPTLQKYPQLEVKSSSLTDMRMYLQITFPTLEREVSTGDVVRAGVVLTNSEVGAGAVDIKSMIWRLACSNGMISGSVLRRYHVGRRVGSNEEDYGLFQDDTIKAELESYRLRMRDVLADALTETSFETQVAKLQDAVEDKILKPNKTVENVTKRFGLTQDQGESILSNMVNELNLNRYGLANGITHLAHETKSIEEQYAMEKLGNDIIELKPDEWEILVA